MADKKKKPAEKATVTRKQHIQKVTAKNFMKLEMVEFSPRRGVIIICGKNDQGKSSFVRFVQCVLGGKYEFPDMVVREGEKTASGEIETEDFIWKWEYDPSKASPHSITIKDKARGKQVKSPQAFSKRMFGKFALNLLRFFDLEPREQLDYCKLIMRDKNGNPIDLEEYQVELDDLTEDRRSKKVLLKSAAAVLDNNPAVVDPPKERVDITALSKQIEEANQVNNDRDKALTLAKEAATRAELAAERVTELERQLEEAIEARAEVQRESVDLLKKANAIKEIQVEPLQKKRDAADETNAAFDKQARHLEARKEHESLDKAVDAVAKALDEHIEEHKKRMEEAQWPVPGLEWKNGRFEYNGIPLAQNSMRNKIFVVWQLAMAENPDLPLALIDDANVLDEDAQAYFKELTAQHDADAMMIMVGENVEGAQLTIRDGNAV